MSSRRDRVAEAERRARRQLAGVLDDIHERRVAQNVPQSAVGAALGWSRSWFGVVERGRVDDVGVVALARMAAAVGLDLSVRDFDAESILRDAGQVKLINRLRAECHPSVPWNVEVPVAREDARAFDVLVGACPTCAAIEAITRFRDAQAQVRRAQLKQEDASIAVLILLIAGTDANRRALREAGAQLRDAFPLDSRTLLAGLRRGEIPRQNGIILL